MYQVLIGSQILYHPGNDEYVIYDTELTETVGQAGEFTFKVPSTNPLYNSVTSGALVTILKDKKEVWRGEIQNISIDFNKVANIYCLEDMAWLGDEYLAPVNLENTRTAFAILTDVLNSYNSTRPESRKFYVGNIFSGNDHVWWEIEYGWSILEAIRRQISGEGSYIKVRRTQSGNTVKRYIDIKPLSEYGKTTTQPIEYGYNLLDYVKESDYGNLTNVITPYGAELEDQEVYEGYSKRIQGDTIANTASINAYGRHAKAVIFDKADTVRGVNILAASYLSRYSQPQLTMEVSAVDLSVIENVGDFGIGDSVHIIAKPFAVDQYLYLTEIKRDIQNPSNNVFTLSGHVNDQTLTNQITGTADMVADIPSEWDILKRAKENALAMLLDETQGGYVVFEYDNPNDPASMTAINICNAKTIEASTKRWRWSQNGFGYLFRDNIGKAWNGPNVAMTMDGSIVANIVNTGTLTASIIKAGVLQDVSKKFTLNMNTGELIMNSGTFKGKLDAATGTFKGKLDAATGEFKGKLTAATGDFNGKVTATSGYIGSTSSGWIIASTNIHSKDGPTKISTKNKAGTYVGTDGFLNDNGKSGNSRKYVQITDGEITANAGKIAGFEITSKRLGDPPNTDHAVGMEGGKTSGSHIFVYHSDRNCRIYEGRIDVHAGADSDRGVWVYSGSDDHNGSYIKHGYSSVHHSQYGDCLWSGSDRRYKEDIEDLSLDFAQELISKLRPRQFKFKSEEGERYGFIAQEVREALDEMGCETSRLEYVSEEGDKMHQLNSTDLIAPLCMLVNDLMKKVDDLTYEVKALKGEANG